ncbi:N-acetylmuramic acid 6-phosphate etherase [Mitsuaria sp. WAJ17]|uniref:N-acetylmuramic acid 6-phosphate etherase n=1 Tax=Mitsuaria sp. WAJ17 TaxID=2761452 RepID=UPI0016047AAA|nr:N-acetylmuramic acid 6-phosphate etherase [Mitsuaria sp. WAJ17]MBB2483910.1 N-acetylmuramic acid 6-phosphate etherase [Mitsuaria sp. WAJ17]
MLKTESPPPQAPALDQCPLPQLLAWLVDDQQQALAAVQSARPQLLAAVEAALPRLRRGGRLVYVGAGTSGRLGVLDGVELTPTFSWPRERALGLMAGGAAAMFEAREGAEDDEAAGRDELQALTPTADDVVIALAASGSTPYVLGAVAAAREAGALSLGLANNAGTPLLRQADIGILLDTGPELIAGSTRLKAGTAQKIALNTLSSALMVGLHRVHGCWMVDMRASNAKLRRRALSLAQRLGQATPEAAQAALQACDGELKPALLMLRAGLEPEAARALLQRCEGHLRQALAASGIQDEEEGATGKT